MQKPSITISDSFIKKTPLIVGILISVSLLLMIFRVGSLVFTFEDLVIGALLISASILGIVVFFFSKRNLPKPLLYFSIFMLWSAFTIVISLHNGVGYLLWARRFFSIFIFTTLGISTVAIFKTSKQISYLYLTILSISVIAVLKSLLPLFFTDASSIPICGLLRNYSGWNYGLLVFSLGIPLLFKWKTQSKILRLILLAVISLSVFSIIISLTRTFWVGAAIAVIFTSFLASRFENGFSFRSFFNYSFKFFIGIGLIAVLTFIIFPPNIKYCFLNRTNSMLHLTQDPALNIRFSETKGLISNLSKAPYEVNSLNSKTSPNNNSGKFLGIKSNMFANSIVIIKNSLKVLIGNGLGASFTYSYVDVAGSQYNYEQNSSHNYYAYIIWAVGFIGLFFFLLGILSFFRQMKRNIYNFHNDQSIFPYTAGISVTLFVAVIISLVVSPLYLNEWAVYYGILLGLGLSYISMIEKNKNIFDYVFITNSPSFYKVNLYNELSKKMNICAIFIGKSSNIRNEDFFSSQINFKYFFLSDGNFENRNIIKSLFKLSSILRKNSFKKIVVGGWDLLEFWSIVILTNKNKNGLVLESTVEESNYNGFKKVLKKIFLKRINTVFASGLSHTKLLEKLDYNKNIYVTKGVGLINKPKFINVNHNFNNNFLFIGRLSEEKNIEMLIMVFNELPQFKLNIFGSGTLESKLKNIANSNINFNNYVENNNIGEVFMKNDVLILPSLSETWGLVVEEALYFGLPVIISNRVGCGLDLLEGQKYGIIFNVSSPQELKDSIINMSNNYSDYRNKVSKFDVENKDKEQIDCYIKALL